MENLKMDVRLALRSLRRHRTYAIAAIAALAMGLGANAAIFSTLDAVLLRPLPYDNADRVSVLWNAYGSLGQDHASMSPPEFDDVRSVSAFDAVSAVSDFRANLTGRGEPVQLSGFRVSPSLFQLLGVRPQIGRDFLSTEGHAGQESVALLSDAVWRTRFGSDAHVLGQTIRLNGLAVTVVGVMPPLMRFPDVPSLGFPHAADVWVARAWEDDRAADRGHQYLSILTRRARGVDQARAANELHAVESQWLERFGDRYPKGYWRIASVPLRDQIVGDVRPAMIFIAAAAGLVLLIACVNVANLVLARAQSQAREVAIRTALGASRARIVRQALTESMILSLGGAIVGILLAWWGVEALTAFGPDNIPRLAEVSVSGRTVAVTLALSIVAGVCSGIGAALRRTPATLEQALRDGGRSSTDRRGQRVRGLLVASELAVATMVVVGAGLLLRSWGALVRVDPGFRADHVLTVNVTPPRQAYPTTERGLAYYDEVFTRLRALPGVEAVGAVAPLPMSGDGWGASFMVRGQPVPPGGQLPHAEHAMVTEGYFDALSIPLIAGRTFTARDDASAPEVVVVDESLARRYWPGKNAVGQQLNVAGRADSVWATVIGVVGHVHSMSLSTAGEPQIYLAARQRDEPRFAIAIRTSGDPLAIAGPVRATVRAVDPDVPVGYMRPLADLVQGTTSRLRFNLTILAIFAATALALAAIGIYGVMSQLVLARAREMGIRLALGAQTRDVVGLVLRHALGIAGVGALVGTLAALASSRAIASLLFGIEATDPVTFVAVPLVLLCATLLAVWAPARRAGRADPLVSLRAD